MGILGNIDDIFTDGDIEVDNLDANAPGSPLRRMFKNVESLYGKELSDPFTIEQVSGKKVLYVKPNQLRPAPIFDCSVGKVSDVVKGIDEVCCVGWLNIAGDRDLTKHIAPTIIADKISVQDAREIKGVNLITRASDAENKNFIPSIMFYNGHAKLTNCKLEFEGKPKGTHNRVIFKGIPTFNNVASDTANYIRMEYANCSDTIWGHQIFNDIFEFGYTVKGVNLDTAKPKTVKINNMTDLVKFVASKTTYDCVFNEYPIRIKKGLKVTDILDVSKFKDLYMISFGGTKIGMFFENTKNQHHTKLALYKSYLYDTPLAAVKDKAAAAKEASMIAQIPVTEDGWMLVLHRIR